MNGDQFVVNMAEMGKLLDWTASERREAEFDFFPVPREMDVHPGAEFARKGGGGLEIVCREIRQARRADGDIRQGGSVGRIALQELARSIEVMRSHSCPLAEPGFVVHLGIEFRVMEVLIARAAGQHQADPRIGAGLDHSVLSFRGIANRSLADSRDPRAEELGCDELCRKSGSGRIQRHHRRHIQSEYHRQFVGDQSAHERLGGMRVPIDHSGHDDRIGDVDDTPRTIGSFEILALADRDDFMPVNGHGSVCDHADFIVEAHDRAEDEKVRRDWFGHVKSCDREMRPWRNPARAVAVTGTAYRRFLRRSQGETAYPHPARSFRLAPSPSWMSRRTVPTSRRRACG